MEPYTTLLPEIYQLLAVSEELIRRGQHISDRMDQIFSQAHALNQREEQLRRAAQRFVEPHEPSS
jgi:hypothetical protein